MRERTALVRLDRGQDAASGSIPSPGERSRWRRRVETARGGLPGPVVRPGRRPLRVAAGLLLVAATGYGTWRSTAPPDELSEHLAEGCEQVEPCRRLEADAARRLQACWLGCGSEQAEHRLARSLRYRAEERSAVRAHYRERDAAERREQRAARERELADWQREQAAQSADAEREQRARLELERLRQDRIDRRVQQERERRVGYLALLAPAARAQRLEHCHAQQASCDALVLDLIDAAESAQEKRDLAAVNERLLRDGVAPGRRAAKPAEPSISASSSEPLGPNS